jgi:SEFIR domain
MSEKTVFISYSHDTPEHSKRVLQLANALRGQGVDAELDQYHLRPPRWCEEQLRSEKTAFVLVICTETYRQRVEGQTPGTKGAVSSGRAESSIATSPNQRDSIEARELQDHHRKQYREYWAWIEKTLNLATYTQQMQTTFGWLLKIGENYNLRAMQNWSMQSNAGDMLRIAINLAVRAGVGVCAPVHDAVLIVAPLDRLDRDTDIMKECMQRRRDWCSTGSRWG